MERNLIQLSLDPLCCRALQCRRKARSTVSGRERPLHYGDRNESRFSLDLEIPLSILGMQVAGDPDFPREISRIQVLDGQKRRFEGPERVVLSDLLEFIKVHDLDVILFPYADTWVPLVVKKARRYGLNPHSVALAGSRVQPPNPTGAIAGQPKGRSLDPKGRVLIDTAKSFVYNEGGLKGLQAVGALAEPDRLLYSWILGL